MPFDCSKLQLVLYFTKGVSLKTWHEGGLLERELALYKALRPALKDIVLVTYGNASDLDYQPLLGNIRMVCNAQDLPPKEYQHWLLTNLPVSPEELTVLKSNQVWGSEIPLQVSRRFKTKSITRCGYLLSDFMKREHGELSQQAMQATQLERQMFALADRAVVTTPAMLRVLKEDYQVAQSRVIPNYVMADVFKPNPAIEASSRQACAIGRLTSQKNSLNLVQAFRNLDITLKMAGVGDLKYQVRREIKKHNLPVTLLGSVAHAKLPELLNASGLYVLPSFYEGHPKTLLEAMSCGRPIVAANTSGIREEIKHKETGFLCGTSAAEIRQAVLAVLGDQELAKKMGENARAHILANYALDRIVDQELQLYQSLF